MSISNNRKQLKSTKIKTIILEFLTQINVFLYDFVQPGNFAPYKIHHQVLVNMFLNKAENFESSMLLV